MSSRLARPALAGLAALTLGCGTLTGARPLAEGEQAVGVTLGGPLVGFAGTYIPLPNLVIEGRSGLRPVLGHPFDVHYGLNATGLAFGMIGLHGGLSWQVLDPAGARPAVSVTERLYFYNAWLNPQAVPGTRGARLIDQVEVTASWMVRDQLLYVGLADYLDLAEPEVLLTPVLGAQLGRPGWRTRIQVEGRWMGVNQTAISDTFDWLGGGRGAIAITAGAQVRLGARGAAGEEGVR